MRSTSLRVAPLSLCATNSDRAGRLWRFAGILASVEARFPLSRNEIADAIIRGQTVAPGDVYALPGATRMRNCRRAAARSVGRMSRFGACRTKFGIQEAGFSVLSWLLIHEDEMEDGAGVSLRLKRISGSFSVTGVVTRAMSRPTVAKEAPP